MLNSQKRMGGKYSCKNSSVKYQFYQKSVKYFYLRHKMQNIPTFINQRNGTNLASANMKKYKKNCQLLLLKKSVNFVKPKAVI